MHLSVFSCFSKSSMRARLSISASGDFSHCLEHFLFSGTCWNVYEWSPCLCAFSSTFSLQTWGIFLKHILDYFTGSFKILQRLSVAHRMKVYVPNVAVLYLQIVTLSLLHPSSLGPLLFSRKFYFLPTQSVGGSCSFPSCSLSSPWCLSDFPFILLA